MSNETQSASASASASAPTLLVLAAGMGSRYGGLKQIDPVGPGGETILDYSVYDALRAGFRRVVFVIREEMRLAFEEQVTSRFADRIDVGFAIQRLDDVPPGVEVPSGRAKPWGTAHAVLSARSVIDGPFVAVNADDFYGADAYHQAAAFLSDAAGRNAAVGTEDPTFALVGYRLRNTLSPHGSVARGLCAVDESGCLTSVAEVTHIVPVSGGGARNEPPGGPMTEFTGDEIVSMNFWAFTPEAFPAFESEFIRFLASDRNRMGGEYYIPTAIDALIRAGRGHVRVLETEAVWFGVTYREDRPQVVAALADLASEGAYPPRLWT